MTSPVFPLKVAVVTGASSGIGLATSERLLKDDYFVVLTARASSLKRFDGLKSLDATTNYWIRPLDVTNALERRTLFDEIQQKLGRLDVLVNNAGVIYRTPIEYAYDFECQEQMLVNFHSPIEMIKLSLPIMRGQGHGHIVNVSSAAGFFSVPTMGLYAASKHALEGASEALYHELLPWNIHVTLVQPGFVTSDTYEKTRLGLVMETRRRETTAIYSAQLRTISALIEKSIRLTTVKPRDVARAISEVIASPHPPLRKQATLDAQVFSFLKRFLPDSAFENLVGFCLGKIGNQMAALEFIQ